MRAQLEHLGGLATRARATVGIIPLDQYPVLLGHGWVQRDRVVTIETQAGSLEIADPTEVSQYERWAEVPTSVALTGQTAARRCLALAHAIPQPSDTQNLTCRGVSSPT